MVSELKLLLIACVSAVVFSGCLTSAPPPPKSWVVSASRKHSSELMVDRVARLGSLSVAAPYDKPALAVVRKDGSVAFDRYNVFASSPSALLRMPLAALLENDGRFGRVLASASTARANSTIEAVVTDLSLDCREDGKRVARVSVSLAVIENREISMFLDGTGSSDAASGDYSAAFSEAFAEAVAEALKTMSK
ncbi:MAG: hypothetical protein E7046_11405 [Lentisphaerae bacterium]|nr:hypothetical protein [Lentisphaerota bacterium]